MAPPFEDRCGARVRRGSVVPEHSTVAPAAAVTLSARGASLIDALRDDPRYRDLIADPFGDHRD